MNIKEVGAGAGGCLLMLVGPAIGLALILMFFKGAPWLAEHVMPPMFAACWIALAVVILILSPMAIFKRARGLAAAGLMIASFVFGVTLWLFGALMTYEMLGAGWMIAGILLFGFGVVPIAFFASLFQAKWAVLLVVTIMLVLTFGVRFFALWASKSVEDYEAGY